MLSFDVVVQREQKNMSHLCSVLMLFCRTDIKFSFDVSIIIIPPFLLFIEMIHDKLEKRNAQVRGTQEDLLENWGVVIKCLGVVKRPTLVDLLKKYVQCLVQIELTQLEAGLNAKLIVLG